MLCCIVSNMGAVMMGLHAHTDDPLSDAADDTARNQDELCHDGRGRPRQSVGGIKRRDASQDKFVLVFFKVFFTPRRPASPRKDIR